MSTASLRSTGLEIWTIYRSPSDFPNKVMARKHIARGGVSSPTFETIIPELHLHGPKLSVEAMMDLELRFVRTAISYLNPSAICFARAEADDPVIVEAWL